MHVHLTFMVNMGQGLTFFTSPKDVIVNSKASSTYILSNAHLGDLVDYRFPTDKNCVWHLARCYEHKPCLHLVLRCILVDFSEGWNIITLRYKIFRIFCFILWCKINFNVKKTEEKKTQSRRISFCFNGCSTTLNNVDLWKKHNL